MPLTWPFLGGDTGNRTPDLLLAKQALYQLSYVPEGRPTVVLVLDRSERSFTCANQTRPCRGLGPQVLVSLVVLEFLLDGQGAHNGGDQQQDLLHDQRSFVQLIVQVV